MSYEEFRKRIDTARQILVGAVPSPAGQIDQITYALMYKFMNDIDDESVSYGGKRQYFTGEYEKFNWHNLMAPSLEAYDRLELYRQAIQGMAKNPNIPELFREIYQNAFLPFNSPNVLTLFLNEINKFSHGDSDDIGDAYEYLLSITGAQGDVGQFRTPRHIIKFIVEAVNPTKTDKVLDPAVGTAGFLIAAYNHVKTQHDGKHNLAPLTADDKTKLHKNYRGYDIDPTMVRTASVNMYLHGFAKPDIRNHDTLSSTDYWDERFDVILANPPFMTPKGGIQPHKKFSIKANRAEVLFVDYIANHLNPVSGRAGIVVPEGIIFQSGKAYKELRKKLVEEYLYAVVSLPAGVFQPYSGVKTSVLLFDKRLAKKQDILFVKVENDGFSLGTQRREVSGNQLPEALEIIKKHQAGEAFESSIAHVVSKANIADSGDYNLSGDRYKTNDISLNNKFPLINLSDIAEIYQPKTITGKDLISNGKYLVYGANGVIGRYNQYNHENEEVTVTCRGATCGTVNFTKPRSWITGNSMVISPKDEVSVDKKFLKYIIDNERIKTVISGSAQPQITRSSLINFQIPLPPLEIQHQIVAELDGYQKIIDAANTIVQSYKPTIKINTEWDEAFLSKFLSLSTGKKDVNQGNPDGKYPFFTCAKDHTYSDGFSYDKEAILIAGNGDVGSVKYYKGKFEAYQRTYILSDFTKDVLPLYVFYVLKQCLKPTLEMQKLGNTMPYIKLGMLADFKIPLPPLDIQRQIVAELEAEQELINANKKLIDVYTQKIKTKLAEIWGE